MTQGKNGRLSIRLELPAGEDPALFWFGVSSRSLKIGDGKGDSQIVPWVEGQAPELDVREGDQIEFCGADERGRLLVSGSATVGGENSLTIPLRRVL